jgi:outer membrane protein assembly factor BamE (lipoprotein component of BamABCDE complex)
MAQLAASMSAEDVLSLLGNPAGREGDTWMYHRMTWATYYVTFGPDQRVVSHHHDP